MLDLSLEKLWPALLLWLGLYVSDFALTLAGARLYRQGAHRFLVHEGGYELEPYFRQDVAEGRVWSWRFVWAALSGAAALVMFSGLAKMAGVPELGEFLVGLLILPELAIHVRHLRNLCLYRQARDSRGAKARHRPDG